MKKSIKKFFIKLFEDLSLFFKTLKNVHDSSYQLYFVLFLDMIYCKFRYSINTNEYRIFKFYSLSAELRKTYLSTKRHERYKKWYIDKNIINVITDKELFNRRFKSFINRDVNNVNDLSFKSFEEYAFENKELLCRSTSSSFISSYKIFNVNNYRSPAYMSDAIRKENLCLIEKVIKQHKDLDAISNNLVTINLVTICTKTKVNVLTSTISFRDENKMISGYVNINKGTVYGHLKDEHDNLYSYFNNYELPYYSEIKEFAKTLAKELEEIREIVWTFTVNSKNEICLLDANLWSDTIFTQQPEYNSNRVGLLPKFKKYNRSRD